MKLILRADDLGISQGVNYGIYHAIKDGPITCVGMMPNMPAATHGYQLIKNLDVCLGQHTNICLGQPVSDPQDIPSLVNADGEFCSSSEIRKRQTDTIDVAECELEIEAQLERFIAITGKKPAYFEGHAVFSGNFFQALKNVAKKHDLFYDAPGFDPQWEAEYGIKGLAPLPLDENNLYDPQRYLAENLASIQKNDCSILVFHPGFLDQYILDHSSYTLIRPMECDFLCSQWLKDWLADNKIECVDFTNYR